MRSEAERLYLSRKRGRGMSARYIAASLMPLLLLILVTAVLAFALSFIFSMSSQIDRMIALMGSGTVYAAEDPEAYLPQDAESSIVRTGSALLYSASGESAVIIKGVDDNYFSGMRGNELDISYSDTEGLNPIVISSSLSDELSLALGDRLTLLMWEEKEERARPFLCTVGGIYESVYPQLDSHLVFASESIVNADAGYEILLPRGMNERETIATLWDNGIPAESYKMMYSSLYSNVQSSIGILSVILLAVALLASFFSSDAAQVYIDRDRKDIKELYMLGLDRKRIRSLYFRLTLSAVTVSAVIGVVLGILLAFLSPLLLKLVAETEPALLEYYVTSFDIQIPYMALVIMVAIIILVAGISIAFSLRRRKY